MTSSKLPNVGVSIFTEMTTLANQHQAINLSQGFPGFDPDPILVKKLGHFAAEGKNQYSPATGVPELRQRLAGLYQYDADAEITITSGASEALFVAISSLVNSGDEVIIIEPAYDLYVPAILLQGGVPIFVQMKHPDYSIDWAEVKSNITSRTKLIIVNTPHNPTGKVLNQSDIKALEEIVEKTGVYVVSDEVYEYITFDGHKHLSLGNSSILREKTIVCSSFAKTLHITGWKVGFCLAPPHLSTEIRKIHQYITFCTFTPAQYAIASYLDNREPLDSLAQFYQRKRDLFLGQIKNPFWTPLVSEGTFFQSFVFNNPIQDKELSKLLTVKAGVASIPNSAFYHNAQDHKVLRFCFAKDDVILLEAAEKLNLVSEYLSV